jgi:hypothetical protein
MLQENLNVGTVVVTKTEKCYYSKWKVTWTSKPGKQPLLHVNTTKLSGNKVTFKNSQTEGGLFFNKIPGEFLRMPTANSQVNVPKQHLYAHILALVFPWVYYIKINPIPLSIFVHFCLLNQQEK